MGHLSLLYVHIFVRDAFTNNNMRGGGTVPILQTLQYGFNLYGLLLLDGFVTNTNNLVLNHYSKMAFLRKTLLDY
jgi:hypothetical protein